MPARANDHSGNIKKLKSKSGSPRQKSEIVEERYPSQPAINSIDTVRTLSDVRLPLAQRRAAALIGRTQGNGYLQKVLNGPADPIQSRGTTPHVQRGEAGVHQDIEMTTWGVDKPTDPAKMTPEQKAAMSAYVGNWMRDFSQFFVPTVFNAVSKAPKRPGEKGGAPIGAKGAEKAMTGLLQALAAMEFGPEITKAFVTGPMLGVYRPEEHMDHPGGMSLGGDVLVRDKTGALAPGDDVPGASAKSQIKGSAGLGPQVENPELYGVSDEGLSKHIYNTKEWVKKEFIAANAAGAKGGRALFASGLHGIEDYFAHSNFIEVALNVLLTSSGASLPEKFKSLPSVGKTDKPVDTLFGDPEKPDKKKREAVTTGTFGPLDTKISISHALLPRLPALFTAIDTSIDEALGLLEKDKMTWAEIKGKIGETPAGAALNFLLDGLEDGGVELPVLILQKWNIPDLPDILPDRIEKFLEGRWLVTGYEQAYMKPSKAIPSYQQLYKDLKAIWEHRSILRDMLLVLLKIPGLDPKTVTQINKAIEALSKSLKEMTDEFRTNLKRQMRSYIMKMIEGMTGVSVPDEKRKELKKWMEQIHHGVEGKVGETSLESRMKEGGDLSGLSGEEKKRRVPEGDLPPSHSEISKDHPSRKKKEGHSLHTEEGRSPFYEMHRELAIFADKHLTVLMEDAWKKTHGGGTIVPGKSAKMEPEKRKSLDESAGTRAEKVKGLSEKDKMDFTQNFVGESETIHKLLNAVDLYIAHPEDGKWWKPILTKYISDHPDEVLADIKARNKTRGARK